MNKLIKKAFLLILLLPGIPVVAGDVTYVKEDGVVVKKESLSAEEIANREGYLVSQIKYCDQMIEEITVKKAKFQEELTHILEQK